MFGRVVAAVVIVLAVAGFASASDPQDLLVDPPLVPDARHSTLLDALQGWGSASPLGIGVDVAPLRPALAPVQAGHRDPRAAGDPGRAISFDLRLAWPVSGGDAWTGPALRPYVTFGPALFVMEPDDPMAWLGDRGDVALSLGVKAGAGISWHIDPDAVLFGEYRVTRGSEERALPLGGAGADVSGFDFLYGVRFRF